jgi:hypothetical protein
MPVPGDHVWLYESRPGTHSWPLRGAAD